MKILVTAGPTREALDPVRFLSNRSSGKMGYAIAEAAASQGHDVRLISGPVSLAAPQGVAVFRVISAADMLEAVLAQWDWCDALVMSAAVADWRPMSVADGKLKKSEMSATLELERTADILETLKAIRQDQVVVGFAAETSNLLAEARRKLETKRLDMVVANDVSRQDAGFEVDTNAVTFVTAEAAQELPLMSKSDVGAHIVSWLEERAPR